MGRPIGMTFHFPFLNLFSPIFLFLFHFLYFVLFTFTFALSLIIYLTFINCLIRLVVTEYYNLSLAQIHFGSVTNPSSNIKVNIV
jgi:hypothetical protein